MPQNKLDELEKALQSPGASGIFVVELRAGSPAAAAGIAPGDIVAELGGKPTPDMGALMEIIQGGGKEPRELKGVKRNGTAFSVQVPAGRLGIVAYAVKAKECAWQLAPDATDPPDFSAFEKDTEWWWRSSFGKERAGYERVYVKRRGDRVEFDHLTWFGGGEGKEKWAFRGQSITTHKLDAILSTTEMVSVTGTKEEGQVRSKLTLGADETWRGESTDAKGVTTKIEERPCAAAATSIYTILLIPLTMPLRAGARRAFPELRESTGTVHARSRVECLGRFDVDVKGKPTPAWCFVWKHWGEGGDNFERIYVSDERRIVRIEWGPHNGGCWCEAIGRGEAGKGIPKGIKVE
jgi:hypothetical protein